MRKLLILIGTLIGLTLLTSIVYAQQLTDWEREVYYALIERTYVVSSDMSDAAAIEFANSYGISIDGLQSIVSKALEQEPTKREWEIYNELWDETDGLSEDIDRAEYDRIYREIANKYDISIVELHEIDFRCLDWDDEW